MVHFILRQNLVIQCSLLEHMLKKINSFYTTSFSILKDKKQSTYETLFKEIKKKKKKKKKNASKISNSIVISSINFRCDFEKSISNAAKKKNIFFLLSISNIVFSTLKDH